MPSVRETASYARFNVIIVHLVSPARPDVRASHRPPDCNAGFNDGRSHLFAVRALDGIWDPVEDPTRSRVEQDEMAPHETILDVVRKPR